MIVSALLTASLAILSLAILGCLYRLIKGPTRPDRVASLDTIGINLLAMIAVICMQLRTQDFIEIVLVIGILTFIGTTALARYIERDAVIDTGGDELDR